MIKHLKFLIRSIIQSRWINLILSNLMIIVIPLTITGLLGMLYNLSTTVDNLSNQVVIQSHKEIKIELESFFNPIIQHALIGTEQGQLGRFGSKDMPMLNAQWIPIVKKSKSISSILLANDKGWEYMLLQEDSTFQNRITLPLDSTKQVTRYRWKTNQGLIPELIKEWVLTSDSSNSPNQKEWFKLALQNQSELPIWTEPYRFLTTKEIGVTCSNSWKDTLGTQYVLAYDVLLSDLSTYVKSLKIKEHGMALLFDKEHRILGFPNIVDSLENFDVYDYNLCTIDDLPVPLIQEAYHHWNSYQKNGVEPFTIHSGGQVYWIKFDQYQLGNNLEVNLMVLVPENDFLDEVNQTKVIIIVGFILVAILIFLILKGYDQKRKDNVSLKKQKEEIERQNRIIHAHSVELSKQKETIQLILTEVKDSIQYAKNIQKAILPTFAEVENSITQIGLFYKPKDIVSGDFYFAQKIDNNLLIMVADCTGHGVPGALMSMLGVSLIRELVDKSEVLSAAAFLNQLRIQLINALNQNQSGTNDGMDLSIVIYDIDKQTLDYAGANNSILISSQANHFEPHSKIEFFTPDTPHNHTLIELRPDKMPIGTFVNMRGFESIQIQLNPSDRVFLFSDGYADQFGGLKNKKFMIKNLKRLILNTSDLSLQNQIKQFESEFIAWKGDFEQVDDVTILSFEV